MIIAFTKLPRRNKTYAGANGNKIAVVYEDDLYMLKFPSSAKLNKDLSYANGCISEYLGCHIFEIADIPVQKTLLGKYDLNGREKIVVACKDFTANGTVLQDFASLKNTIIGSSSNGYGTELDEILETIEDQVIMDPAQLRTRFWDMFIVDALIGNWDRHNGNWGFLYNMATDEMSLAPVYDCGSTLYPQADEKLIERILSDPEEMRMRIFSYPLSGIKKGGQKINYQPFLSSLEYSGCNEALKRIQPRLNLQRINELIDATPFISDLQKEFYRTTIRERKEKILDMPLQKLQKRERKLKQYRNNEAR